MNRLLSLLPLVALMLVGCRSGGPTVNPFMGSATVPAQPTGAIGPGANNAPYYPPNVVPGQPSTVPPSGPYGVPPNTLQPGWNPQGTGAMNSAPNNGQFAAAPNALRSSGEIVDLDSQMRANSTGMYDPNVRQASAAMPANTNTVTISNPVSYKNASESAVRVPTDSSPLVTQRLQLPAVVQAAPITAAPAAQYQQQPTTMYDPRQTYVQTIAPTQTATAQPAYTPQSMPAARVYAGNQPYAMTVTQQQFQPYYPAGQQIQLQPIPQYQPTLVASNSTGMPTLATSPSPAYSTTLASAQTPVTQQLPAMEITDLPPARSAFP